MRDPPAAPVVQRIPVAVPKPESLIVESRPPQRAPAYEGNYVLLVAEPWRRSTRDLIESHVRLHRYAKGQGLGAIRRLQTSDGG